MNPLLLDSRAQAPSPGLCCLSTGPLSSVFPTSSEPSTCREHEHVMVVVEGGMGLSGRVLVSWVDLGWLGRCLRHLWAGGRQWLSSVLVPSVWA